MASYDDVADEEPPSIDPYEVLGLDREATADQVKSAYRKAALKTHPDKVADDKKDEAKIKFQEVAFAYAVLSDPARRKRYDETGSTSEAIIDSDGFSWSDYYRAQFQDAVSADAIKKFAAKYRNSDEEKDDILVAYEQFEGDMDGVYETVMLTDVLEDDERIRKIIDDAIASGDVEAYPKYTKETKKSKAARVRVAKGEGYEAMQLAKKLSVHDKLFGKDGKKSEKESEASLAALIKANQARRGEISLDALAEKYAPKTKSGKKRKPAAEPDISDAEFEAIQAKMQANKAKKSKR
ncbi:DnaJ domain-containing protein [Podospora aff. communis PSN243]|uniref:DnaJ domain-containing protein n=1 Tax=Podospora aff. communis PSN243 TaxID=3040156 RepID=A0AAV9H1D3_9PEZI|nr:DnaJ domain-containing protein [Podospora aff. communis PSN243]